MISLAAITLTSTAVSVFGVSLTVLFAAALLAAQWRRGVIKELRESFAVAEKEIAIHRGIVERLSAQITSLDARCSTLEAENHTLREILSSGAHLAPLLREEFDRFQREVTAGHKKMAAHLAEPERSALLRALE